MPIQYMQIQRRQPQVDQVIDSDNLSDTISKKDYHAALLIHCLKLQTREKRTTWGH